MSKTQNIAKIKAVYEKIGYIENIVAKYGSASYKPLNHNHPHNKRRAKLRLAINHEQRNFSASL